MRFDFHQYVDFRGDFERPESFDEPSGKELAAVLADALARDGIAIISNEGVDFAHYVECQAGVSTIELMVGAELLDGGNDRWYVHPCRKRTFFGRKQMIDTDLLAVLLSVNGALRECPRVSDIRWYPSFDTPEYLALMPRSDGPVPQPDYDSNLHPLIRCSWRLNEVTGMITHPLGIFSIFILVCALMVAAPESGKVIASALFFTALALMTVVPFVLSILVSREARRLSASDG